LERLALAIAQAVSTVKQQGLVTSG